MRFGGLSGSHTPLTVALTFATRTKERDSSVHRRYIILPIGIGAVLCTAGAQQCTNLGASDDSVLLAQYYCDEVVWELEASITSDNGGYLYDAGEADALSACIQQSWTDCQGTSHSPVEYAGAENFTAYPDWSGETVNFYWTLTDQHLTLQNCSGNPGQLLYSSPTTRSTGYYEALCN